MDEADQFASLLFADDPKAAAAAAAATAAYVEESVPSRGLLDDLPAGVNIEEATWGKRVLDFSMPAAAEAVASSSSSRPAGSGQAARGVIPQDSKGFGSDDLFGASEEQTSFSAAGVLNMLPDQIREQIKGSGLLCAGEEPPPEPRLTLEEEQQQKTLNRACEGRWVPTYMRQQLRENGHTSIPTEPHLHEYRADAPPPTLGSTFQEMGEEFGQTAQSMLNFMLTVYTSLAFQCQMCTSHTATTAHERVMAFGDGICSEVNVDREEEYVFGILPIPDEETAGYGPMRSRLARAMKEVSFKKVMEICRQRLLTSTAPAEFLRFVPARELRQNRTALDQSYEDWVFATEVNPAVLSDEALSHVGSLGGHLVWRERWHVKTRVQHACVEITNEPSSSPVSVVMRIDIKAVGEGCEVDSRLYARSQDTSITMPLGLVEQLFEAHHQHCERLRDAMIALAGDSAEERGQASGLTSMAASSSIAPGYLVSGAFASSSASSASKASPSAAPPPLAELAANDAPTSPLPVVGWQLPAKRPPSWASDPRMSPAGGKPGSNLDKSFLMQVADGI